jgi:hypothetical protein
MKTVLFCLGMLLLSGCERDDVSQSKPRVYYPALNESPPPPPPPSSDTSEQPLAEPDAPSSEITGDSGFQRETEKADQVKRLREYAAKADPGDPFAMTEKEIEAFSKLENPVLN